MPESVPTGKVCASADTPWTHHHDFAAAITT